MPAEALHRRFGKLLGILMGCTAGTVRPSESSRSQSAGRPVPPQVDGVAVSDLPLGAGGIARIVHRRAARDPEAQPREGVVGVSGLLEEALGAEDDLAVDRHVEGAERVAHGGRARRVVDVDVAGVLPRVRLRAVERLRRVAGDGSERLRPDAFVVRVAGPRDSATTFPFAGGDPRRPFPRAARRGGTRERRRARRTSGKVRMGSSSSLCVRRDAMSRRSGTQHGAARDLQYAFLCVKPQRTVAQRIFTSRPTDQFSM